MKVGLYPGSFNPFHIGHKDILNKALKIFDRVILLKCQNPEKAEKKDLSVSSIDYALQKYHPDTRSRIHLDIWTSTLISYMDKYQREHGENVVAMIRGLRNGMDLEYEIAQQGLHEDTGNHLPFVCFLTDRKYGHVSSSAIRGLDKLGLKHGYTEM